MVHAYLNPLVEKLVDKYHHFHLNFFMQNEETIPKVFLKNQETFELF